MAYTVTITPFDLGSFFAQPPAPALTGRFESSPGTVADRAGPVAGLSALTFPMLPSPPATAGAMHIVDTTTGGDLYRSGIQASWPALANLRLYTLPTNGNAALPNVRTTFTNAQLLAMVGPFVGRVLPVPAWVTALAGATTGFMFVPLSMTIAAIGMGPTPLNFIVTGTISFRQLFFNRTSRFTAIVTVSAAPSGDALHLNRILAIGLASAALDPGFITPLISATISLLTPLIAQALTSLLDDAVNKAIRAAVDGALSAANPPQELSPTASICARKVTATSSGVSVQAVLSDLFTEPRVNKPVHPAVPVSTPALVVSVAPTPRAGVLQAYVITVRSSAGGVVSGASVRLTNYDARGTASTISSTTDASGRAVFNLALRARSQRRVIAGDGEREVDIEFHPPLVRAEKPGFSAGELALLSAP